MTARRPAPRRNPAQAAALAALDQILAQAAPTGRTTGSARPAGRSIADTDMHRVLASTPSQLVRIWLALAWSGVLPADIPNVEAGHLALGGRRPSVNVQGKYAVGLDSLAFAVLARATLPASGLLTSRADGRPWSVQHVTSTCGSWMRHSGVTITLYEVATRPQIGATRPAA